MWSPWIQLHLHHWCSWLNLKHLRLFLCLHQLKMRHHPTRIFLEGYQVCHAHSPMQVSAKERSQQGSNFIDVLGLLNIFLKVKSTFPLQCTAYNFHKTRTNKLNLRTTFSLLSTSQVCLQTSVCFQHYEAHTQNKFNSQKWIAICSLDKQPSNFANAWDGEFLFMIYSTDNLPGPLTIRQMSLKIKVSPGSH